MSHFGDMQLSDMVWMQSRGGGEFSHRWTHPIECIFMSGSEQEQLKASSGTILGRSDFVRANKGLTACKRKTTT